MQNTTDEIHDEIKDQLTKWEPETVGTSYLELLARGEWKPNKILKSEINDTRKLRPIL